MSLLLRGLKGIRGGRAVLITPSNPTDPVRPTPWASTWKNVVFSVLFFYSALWHWYHIMIWSPVLSTIVPLPLFTLYIILNPQMDYTRRGGEGRIQNNNGRPPAFQDLPSDKWAFALYHCSIFPWPCFVSFSTKFKSISSLCCKISRHLEN